MFRKKDQEYGVERSFYNPPQIQRSRWKSRGIWSASPGRRSHGDGTKHSTHNIGKTESITTAKQRTSTIKHQTIMSLFTLNDGRHARARARARA